jgi:AraC family transcriptional regulator, transcriptional activator of pobA
LASKKDITDVYFKSKQRAFEFEILPLNKLFSQNISDLLTSPHRMHFYQILVVTHGKSNHVVDFKHYSFGKGDLLFVAPGQVQQFGANMRYDGFLVLFTDAFFSVSGQDVDFLRESSIFDVTVSNSLIHPHKHLFEMLQFILQSMQSEYAHEYDWATPELLRGNLRNFLVLTERLKRNEQPSVSRSKYLNDYYLFKQLLEKKFKEERRVDYYADELNVIPKKLNRITQSIIGKSAKKFIDDRVVLEIKRLLLHSRESVKDIAYGLHFDEPTNLVKFFKKHTGISPTEFKVKPK